MKNLTVKVTDFHHVKGVKKLRYAYLYVYIDIIIDLIMLLNNNFEKLYLSLIN